ncbi:hypothetical protein SAMN04488073_0002 [Marinobacter gudaonensis]|uniref:Uncharacterized protein n=1 Tax=Marinobacter gudaonensis TaxID=375760 RepID=A0A1I6G5D9_9GAMM|nr:hypothetical protein [Marinobacter gudaonensis]SFR37351.1 hypothetical protein SAMN04488073_0002 [Marinobacter gudaonensis]
MNILGYIILLVAMVVICLVKKQNMERMRTVIDPMFGVGLILVGAGNFMSGEMIGSQRVYNLLNSYTVREMWTMESDPVPFVAVNVFFLLAGAGLIGWRFLKKAS